MQINKHKRIKCSCYVPFLASEDFRKIISGIFDSNLDSNLGFLFSWSGIYIDLEQVEF